MTTYKYQQNMFEGAAEGYVKYNITPDFGTVMKAGDTFQISGQLYWRDMKTYGIGVAVSPGSGSYTQLGVAVKTAEKKTVTSFTLEGTITQAFLNRGSSRFFSAPLRFTLYNDDSLSSGSVTFAVEGQELSLVKSIDKPKISNIHLTDAIGAYERFGYVIQNKSKMVLDFDYTVDTLIPGMAIKTFEVYIAGSPPVILPIASVSDTQNHARITLEPIKEVRENVYLAITITDTAGGARSDSYATLITILMYSPPALSTIEGYPLVKRYDYKMDDYGEEQQVFTADGVYAAVSVRVSVTKIGYGNGWTVKAYFRAEGEEEWVESTGGILNTAGGEFSIIEDSNLIHDDYKFDPSIKYEVKITVTDSFETAVLIGEIEKAAGYFNVTKNGVSMNMRSTATPENPMNEVLFPFYAYQGIADLTCFVQQEHQAGLSIAKEQLFSQTLTVPVTSGTAVSIPISRLGNVYRIDGVLIAPSQSVWPINCYIDSNTRCACYRVGAARALTLSSVGMTGTAYVTALYSKADTEDPTAEYLWNNGPNGYDWVGNVFTRPSYTGSANGVVSADVLKITLPSVTGSNAIPFNAHVCTSDVVTIPAGLTKLNVTARKTSSTTTYMNFGLIASNAANSYSVANGGQLSGEVALTTADNVYTIDLSADIYALSNLKCIINGKASLKNGTAAAGAVISKVWFD